jgi:hypothetical protein
VQAAPRESLQVPLLVHWPSRLKSRVHADGSGRVDAARWLHWPGHMKSIGAHAAMHAPTSKPTHC